MPKGSGRINMEGMTKISLTNKVVLQNRIKIWLDHGIHARVSVGRGFLVPHAHPFPDHIEELLFS